MIKNPDTLKKLNEIRSGKYVEPQNTGINHPVTIYIPVGHGGEKVGERRVVPKGCILVVKSHSGDTTLNGDFIINAKAILDLKNKEVMFDPVSHKKELYSLLTSKQQARYHNISASASTAIYREGDTYNNFIYQMVNSFSDSIGPSGIFSLDNSSVNTDFKNIDQQIYFDKNTKVFVKDASNNYIYSPDIIKLDIPSFFSNSDTYEYYYTQQHIQDILDVILTYINLLKDGYIDFNDIEEKIVNMLGKKYLNIKKGYTYVQGKSDTNNSPLKLIFYKSVSDECKKMALESKDKKDNPVFNILKECMVYLRLGYLFGIIISITNTTQADLFKDVEAGIIKPGIFYNIICRATNHTLHTENKNMDSADGILDTKYIENSDHNVKVKNESGEIKNRISEAVLQRKNQAKQVFNNKATKIKNSSVLHENMDDTYTYVHIMLGNTYKLGSENYINLINLERIKKNIKLKAFNYIVAHLNYIVAHNEFYKDELKLYNTVLSNYYSKNALLSENKYLSGLITKETNPKEIEFLKSKIEFNNNFIKDHIKQSWFSAFKPTQYITTPEVEKEDPKILTNNYKKYRNETAKKYKKVNGKWVENISIGGRRTTRKRK